MKISRTVWIIGFLGTLSTWTAEELIAALDHDPNTVPLTSLLVDYVPPWLLIPGVVFFAVWLVAHIVHYVQLHREGKA